MLGISLFTGAFALAKRTGFLDTGIGRTAFIEAYFQYKKHLEDPFDGLIRRHPELFRGGDILDAGANIGYCSVLFSRAVDAGRTVFAFEPEPFNVSLLERVIRTRAKERVVVVPAAVGATDGDIGLQLNPRHHGDHRVVTRGEPGTITVPLLTIDRFLEQRKAETPVCLLKIDVQGYELAVCEGAARTLARNPDCRVVLEYMPEAMEALGFRPQDLLAWFEQRGYESYVLRKDGSLARGIPAGLGARGYADVLFSPIANHTASALADAHPARTTRPSSP